MSATNLFRNTDPMPSEQDPMSVNTLQTPPDSVIENKMMLPGQRKFPNDVASTRVKPQATGRRP